MYHIILLMVYKHRKILFHTGIDLFGPAIYQWLECCGYPTINSQAVAYLSPKR
jgi:hypothetical protein